MLRWLISQACILFDGAEEKIMRCWS